MTLFCLPIWCGFVCSSSMSPLWRVPTGNYTMTTNVHHHHLVGCARRVFTVLNLDCKRSQMQIDRVGIWQLNIPSTLWLKSVKAHISSADARYWSFFRSKPECLAAGSYKILSLRTRFIGWVSVCQINHHLLLLFQRSTGGCDDRRAKRVSSG